jgi:Cys-rich four helix bundle protein (predicted Tat secretion target)
MSDRGFKAAAISRRTVLLTAAAGVAMPGASALAQPAPAKHAALAAAAKRCVEVGEICLKHCIKATEAGDKSLVDCLRTTRAMLAVTTAMAQFAEQNAKRLKPLAKVCLDVCRDCEAECRKHITHHAECKACFEACGAMISQLKRLAA